MKKSFILGIETATTVGGAAIAGPDGVVASFNTDLRQSHSRRMVSLVARAAEAADAPLRELAGVGVSLGPGSFTGVRIGLSIAKGLCLAGNMPLVGVSTLEALAERSDETGLVCPILDARRGEIYAALFRRADRVEPSLERLAEDACLSLDDWLERLQELASGDEPVAFTGHARERFAEPLLDALGSRTRFADPERELPAADSVALLAWRRLRDDPAAGREWDTLEPEYVRSHDASPPRRENRQTRNIQQGTSNKEG